MLEQDAIASSIIEAWKRQPWCDVHRLALADRAEEMGHSAAELIRNYGFVGIDEWKSLPRWKRRVKIKWWFKSLLWYVKANEEIADMIARQSG